MTTTEITWTVNRNVRIGGSWFHLVEINDGRRYINGHLVSDAEWQRALARSTHGVLA